MAYRITDFGMGRPFTQREREVIVPQLLGTGPHKHILPSVRTDWKAITVYKLGDNNFVLYYPDDGTYYWATITQIILPMFDDLAGTVDQLDYTPQPSITSPPDTTAPFGDRTPWTVSDAPFQ